MLETTYGIVLQKPGENEDPSRPPTPEELLQPYAKQRGFMTAHGAPNEAQAARQMLRDYMVVRKSIVFCDLLQGKTTVYISSSRNEFQSVQQEYQATKKSNRARTTTAEQ